MYFKYIKTTFTFVYCMLLPLKLSIQQFTVFNFIYLHNYIYTTI